MAVGKEGVQIIRRKVGKRYFLPEASMSNQYIALLHTKLSLHH